MESKKHLDITAFYELCKVIDGVITSPKIWTYGEDKHYREWTIYVALVNVKDPNDKKPIIEDYVTQEAELPKNYVGGYWTYAGVENSPNRITSDITLVTDGTGRGKAETTPLTQAIHKARSLYNDNMNNGYKVNKDELITDSSKLTIAKLCSRKGDAPWRIKPMALHNFVKYGKRIVFPAYVQNKADGGNMTVVLDEHLPHIICPTTDGKKVKIRGDAYTRGLDAASSQFHIVYQLYKLLKEPEYKGFYIVGESYTKGQAMEKASGNMRRVQDTDLGVEQNDYYIFDCYHLSYPEMTFEERHGVIQSMQLILDSFREEAKAQKKSDPAPNIKFVTTVRVRNNEQMQQQYQQWLDEGWEGAVVHNADSLYEFGIDRERRSSESLKLKPRPDEEYPIVGFTRGKGKFENVLGWDCAENEKGCVARIGKVLPISERETFTAYLNKDLDYCAALYNFLSKNQKYFNERILHAKVTVTYHKLSSKKKVPMQGRVIKFFDPKIERDLEKQAGL
jgi:hypothetical protein